MFVTFSVIEQDLMDEMDEGGKSLQEMYLNYNILQQAYFSVVL